MKRLLGIVGGLGPLASTDFLMSIYEQNAGATEQDDPAVVLYSDPSVPDRTDALLKDRAGLLIPPLEIAIERLLACGVDSIVIACVTIHRVLPQIDPALRRRVISLVDIMLDALASTKERTLLLATTGARRTRIFEDHELWPQVANYVVYPDDADQLAIHKRIYEDIKRRSRPHKLAPFIDGLCAKYEVGGWIAGCTELHRVSRYLRLAPVAARKHRVIDPLMIIASNYEEFVHGKSERSNGIWRASFASSL